MTISLCMIVKNEEARLAACLASAKPVADEIIIVDTGSTDDTVSVARTFTDKIFTFPWCDDFSAARNFAFSKAECDMQWWLDADEVLPPAAAEALLALKQSLAPTVDIVTMQTVMMVDGQAIVRFGRERLLRRDKGYIWLDPVHECIPLVGDVLHTEIEIHHHQHAATAPSDRNLNIYRNLAVFSPRRQYYYARELRDHGRWEEAAAMFTRFLDGNQGWTEDNIAACLALAACETHLGNTDGALSALLRSFRVAPPRAAVLCALGYHYKKKNAWDTALGWFRLAIGLTQEGLGFQNPDDAGYIPNIECCVCCAELGDHLAAQRYNEAAETCKPGDAGCAHNRAFLQSRISENGFTFQLGDVDTP